ncbi:MAG: hypothetical protein CME59_01995 [Halioglobus sp.]|nr:hypothetical protein [Halioglobus sp.]
MKILYGVQATGQGHISRARAMAAAFARHPQVEVQWLFSGRPRDKLFDMQPFGDYLHRRGLTFATDSGRIRYRATVTGNNPAQFLRDVRELDLARYDLVVTDFEPVCAWAARRHGVRSIGIGHQYAFGAHTPVRGGNALGRFIMRHFAPVDLALGLHWAPYGGTVLPPILDLPDLPLREAGHILVYLPFEDQEAVTRLLGEIPGQEFVQYASGLRHETRGNVTRHPANTQTFKRHLASSVGVICNSGFELVSECLHWRKPVLTKPLNGQMEQLSNALALEQLGYATTCDELTCRDIRRWLADPLRPPACGFPDVAAALARWLASGCREAPAILARELWPRLDQGHAGRRPEAGRHASAQGALAA